MHRILMSSLIYACSILPSAAEVGRWEVIPNTQLKQICPTNKFNDYPYDFSYHCGTVTGAWSGAALSQQRGTLYIWGGGHNDYYGNEIYGFNIRDKHLLRLTDPAYPANATGAPKSELSPFDGTQPNGRHTYDGLNVLEKADLLWAFSGSLASGSGGADRETWLMDLATHEWRRDAATGDIPRKTYGLVSAYDPINDRIYLHDTYSFYQYQYTPKGGRYLRLSDSQIGLDLTAAFDPLRKRFLMLGKGKQFLISTADGSDFRRQKIPLPSDLKPLHETNAPGLVFDSKRKRFVAWAGGPMVFIQDPQTMTWHSIVTVGAPNKATTNGTFGRFAYWRERDLFVLINNASDNIRVLKLAE